MSETASVVKVSRVCRPRMLKKYKGKIELANGKEGQGAGGYDLI